MKYCTHCATELAPHMRSCPCCGHRHDEHAVPIPPFFRGEQEHAMTCQTVLHTADNVWEINLPVNFRLKTQGDSARFAWQLCTDHSERDPLAQLESMVQSIIARQTRSHLFSILQPGCPVSENSLAHQVADALDGGILQRIARSADDLLECKCGVQLAGSLIVHPCDMHVKRLIAMTEVLCPYPTAQGTRCGHMNRVPEPDYRQRKSFVCEKCGQQLTWCPHCRMYVTTARRRKVCDLGQHVIY